MNTQDKIKVMQAYLDGKEIEYRYKNESVWKTLPKDFNETWNWGEICFRVSELSSDIFEKFDFKMIDNTTFVHKKFTSGKPDFQVVATIKGKKLYFFLNALGKQIIYLSALLKYYNIKYEDILIKSEYSNPLKLPDFKKVFDMVEYLNSNSLSYYEDGDENIITLDEDNDNTVFVLKRIGLTISFNRSKHQTLIDILR